MAALYDSTDLNRNWVRAFEPKPLCNNKQIQHEQQFRRSYKKPFIGSPGRGIVMLRSYYKN